MQYQFELDPHDKDTIFLFCGRKNDRIKALLWEGDGFLLMYKRVEKGSFKVHGMGVYTWTMYLVLFDDMRI